MDFSSVLFATLLKTIILSVIVAIIYHLVPVSSPAAEQGMASFVFPASFAHPENQERISYLLILFLFLPLSWILNRSIRSIPPSFKVISWILAFSVVLSIWSAEYFFYFQAIPDSALVLLIAGIILWGLYRINGLKDRLPQTYNISRRVYWTLAGIFIFIHFWIRLIPEIDGYWMGDHCEAILFANWQVLSGKTLTIDVFHQYGLYPEFLRLIWKVSGRFTFLKFSATLSLLAAVYHYCLFCFAATTFRQKLLGFFIVAGAIQFASFFTSTFTLTQNIYDPYFQYAGVRTFFPGLLLYFVAKLREKSTSGRTVFYTLVLSFAPFWNMDTGLVCLGSWFIYLMTQQKSLVWPVVFCLGSFVAATLVVTGYLFLKSGQTPDYLSLLRYQTQFYGLGFYMIPMPLVHSWIIYGLITAFAAGVYFNKPCPDRGWILCLSVLSAGIFSYYQGRSHPVVFSAIVFPVALLLGLGLDQLPWQNTLPKPFAIWLCSLTIVASGLGILGSTMVYGSVFRAPKARNLFRSQPGKLFPLADSITFLKSRTSPGQTVWILSNNASVYHVASQTVSPLRSSLIEMFKRTEVDLLVKNILRQPTVFADVSVLNTNTVGTNPALNQILEHCLVENFTKQESDPSGRLSLWKKRN